MTPEEEELLRQQAAANNSMTQPYDLIGQQGQQETGMDTNPLLMGGLGLGGGFVASQTGGAPATSQVLSSLAQKVAAQDAANLAAQRAAFRPAIIGQNLPTGGANPAVTGQPKLPFQTPSSVFGSNLPAGGPNPEVKGRVKPNVFNRPNIKSTTPLTPNKVLGGLNANPLSSIASNLLKGSAYTAAVTPNLIGDSTLTGAYNSAVAAGEDPATAAARLGTADTSIRGLDTSNREVDFMPDGTGVLNGVSLFTGGAETTGMNYADVVNADNARKAQEAQYAAAAQAEAVADANAFVPPLDFAGEIQNAPETYSGLVENNPFTSMGGTPVEDNQYTMEREAGNVAPVAQANEVAPGEGFMSRLVGRLGEQFTQPAPYTPQGGGAEAETAFGATPTQPTLFREGLSALSELNETPLTSPNSFQTEAPIVPAPASPIAALQSQAAPGSPQAFFEEYRSRGPLTPEQIARGEAEAARMGTTFDPETGFSREPFLQSQQGQAPQANRPGYGYGGAVNDQYQGADFDTISQGVFDTPMTGMRPINAETGEPLSQGVIDAAARAGLELPMGSVPLPQAPVNSVPMGRDETRARLGGMTLNQYLDAADGAVSGLRTDPQGRMIPSRGREAQDSVFAYDDMTRADAYKGYEGEASAREGRLAARMQQPGESITERDTRIAGERTTGSSADGGPRTYGGYTTAQLRGMVGGGDALRAAQMRAEAGLNPITGNREKTEAERAQSSEQGQLQTEVLKARLDKLKEQEPDKLSKAESYADRLQLQGDARTAFIFSQMGTAMDDVFGLEGTGAGGGGGSFTEAQESSISKVMGANPGSSREQIIAEMKKQGKL